VLAREAALHGPTRERVITALVSRIRRDEGYLAYRKAAKRHTNYDEQVHNDLRAFALAAVLLEDSQSAPARTPFQHQGGDRGGSRTRTIRTPEPGSMVPATAPSTAATPLTGPR
jgi:hypothetical protein